MSARLRAGDAHTHTHTHTRRKRTADLALFEIVGEVAVRCKLHDDTQPRAVHKRLMIANDIVVLDRRQQADLIHGLFSVHLVEAFDGDLLDPVDFVVVAPLRLVPEDSHSKRGVPIKAAGSGFVQMDEGKGKKLAVRHSEDCEKTYTDPYDPFPKNFKISKRWWSSRCAAAMAGPM